MTDKKLYCPKGHEAESLYITEKCNVPHDHLPGIKIVCCMLIPLVWCAKCEAKEGSFEYLGVRPLPGWELKGRPYLKADCTSEPPKPCNGNPVLVNGKWTHLWCYGNCWRNDKNLITSKTETVQDSACNDSLHVESFENIELLIDKLVGLTCEYYSWENPPSHITEHLKTEAKNTRLAITDAINKLSSNYPANKENLTTAEEPSTVEYCECKETFAFSLDGKCAICHKIKSNLVGKEPIKPQEAKSQHNCLDKVIDALESYSEELDNIGINNMFSMNHDFTLLSYGFKELAKKLKELRGE